MSRPCDGLDASYAACRQVARRARSSFYPCFLLLRGPRRRAMEALYAFLRHTDDLGDSTYPVAQRREAIAAWRQALADALGAERSAVGHQQSAISLPPSRTERGSQKKRIAESPPLTATP